MEEEEEGGKRGNGGEKVDVETEKWQSPAYHEMLCFYETRHMRVFTYLGARRGCISVMIGKEV